MQPRNKKAKIELLAPARSVEIGFEAIRHGADAVYIGGPSFGARAAAGNSVDDIGRLCQFAHLFGARVYVTLNTILWDSELAQAEELIWQLYRAGTDALIVQDLSLLRMHLPPIALHASTQMDNCTPEKAQWLEAAGFRQIVLARETSLEQTRRIADSVSVPLEAFVHGALCVSYSGRCYASQHCFGRSANRGCCAQFCRLAFNLVDDKGRTLVADKHLLSLKDMNRTASLEEMMDAGVRSFKIEGRLKDVEYVKNVTAWYRQEIDKVIARRADSYERSSFGTSEVTFSPNVVRSFNRGFTEYFLHGRSKKPIYSPYTPKAVGEEVGSVTNVSPRAFRLRTKPHIAAPLTAGDGLCFIDKTGKLQGFRVNKVEGDLIYPLQMPALQRGDVLFRNQDFAFSKLLAKPTAERRLRASLTLRETADGYALDMSDESGCHATKSFASAHDEARSPQRENIQRQLAKLGDTPFTAENIDIQTQGERFIPSSTLATWRREICELLLSTHRMSYERDRAAAVNGEKLQGIFPEHLPFTANVANREAEAFYKEYGVRSVAPAFELQEPKGEKVLMTCRHCIRHELGICLKGREGRQVGNLSLQLPDGRTFPLRFDCKRCEMQVLSDN